MAAAGGETTFDLVFSESRGRPLRVKASFEESSIRCETGSGKVFDVQRADIAHADFTQVNKFWQLRMTLNDGSARNLHGFKRAQLDEIAALCAQHLGLAGIERVETASKGWNWGRLKQADRALTFVVDERVGFEIPYAAIADARDTGRNQVTIEVQQDENAKPDDDCLTDMRFFIPSADADFVDGIKERAKVGLNSAESIASFDQMNFVVPRGRFTVEVHSNLLKLKGLSASYNILHKNIAQLYLLQRPDGHRMFVMNVEPPLRSGSTTYNYLLIQIRDDDLSEVELNMSDEELAKHEKLTKNMQGVTAEVFGHIVRAISGRPVFQTGTFRSAKNEFAVRCSLKNDSGYLFPLEKRFVYINKPTTIVKYDEISSVEFTRVGKSAKDSKSSFDLVVNYKADIPPLTFTGIARDELNTLHAFVSAKNLKVHNAQEMADATSKATGGDDDDDDDDDEDSDFAGGGTDSGSDSGSLSGSQASNSDSDSGSGSGSDGGKKKKKQKKRRASSGSESGSDSDSGSGSGSDGDKKKKKKDKKKKEKKEKKEKKKKSKESGGPKKPTSAFLLFSVATRKSVQEAEPSLDFAALNKKLGEMWKDLDHEKRREFEIKANADRQRYEREMEAAGLKVKKSSKRGYSDDEAPAGDADAPAAAAAAGDMHVDDADADAVKMEEVADA